MNARKSLGGVVCSTWYAVVITCREHHWSYCQREPAHVAETMKFMASLQALGWDLWVAVIHQMSPRSWALYWRTWQNQRGKKTRQLNPRPLRLPVEAGEGQGGRHIPKPQGLECRSRGPQPCNREGAKGGWQTDRLSVQYSKIAQQLLSSHHYDDFSRGGGCLQSVCQLGLTSSRRVIDMLASRWSACCSFHLKKPTPSLSSSSYQNTCHKCCQGINFLCKCWDIN